MLLNNNNDIIVSANSTFTLNVELTNYYIKSTDRVVFTVNKVQYDCNVFNRITINVEFEVELSAGDYDYDIAIINNNKVLTILSGKFMVKPSLKNYLINLFHKLYRKDPWLNNVCDSVGISLSVVDGYIDTVEQNNYFDTASEQGIEAFEKEAKVYLSGGQTLEDRRSQLMAKWRGASKCTLVTLQNVADAWRNATIKVQFLNGKIHIKFISPLGVPPDLNALKKALENVKPAHLAIQYSFLYKTWGTAREVGTWGQHKINGEWNKLRQNEV